MKLVYILNHYSRNSHSHFYHVLHLLEVMASGGVDIALVIEKCEDIPPVEHPSIRVIAQKAQNKSSRPFELAKILYQLHREGYSHVYIRITWVAAVVAIIVSWFTRQKIFYWLSGQGTFEHYRQLKPGITKMKEWLTSRLPFAFIRKYVYRFVTGPETMKAYFVQMGNVPAHKITVLYNDIDISRFSVTTLNEKKKLRQELGLPQDTTIVFFAHRFSPVRRTLFYIPYILEAVAADTTTPIMFIIAGSGPEEAALKQVIAASAVSGKIQLIGNIPNARIHTYYKAADIFINPTYAEGFPRVLIEAMASGLPVVTTDAGGIVDIVGEKQAQYMVPKDDRAAFAQRLQYLLEHPEEQSVLADENRATARRFSTEAVAQMYIKELFKA